MAGCSRRTLVATAVSLGIASVSGCFMFTDGLGPGMLVIHNELDEQVAVTVEVERRNDDAQVTRDDPGTPVPEEDPLWSDEATFDVEAEGRLEKDGFVTEPGAYYVRVDVENRGTGAGWVGVSRSTEGGMSAGYIDIQLTSDGDVEVDRGVKV
jgi:hypothetical protein